MRKQIFLIAMLGAVLYTPAISQENIMKVYCGNKLLSMELADNQSAKAFAEKVSKGDIKIKMSDYGNFEKTGSLGFILPRSDENINTSAGDVILYQGSQITIYYAPNSWNFTKLAKIEDVSDLKEKLGKGSIEATFSLAEPS